MRWEKTGKVSDGVQRSFRAEFYNHPMTGHSGFADRTDQFSWGDDPQGVLRRATAM